MFVYIRVLSGGHPHPTSCSCGIAEYVLVHRETCLQGYMPVLFDLSRRGDWFRYVIFTLKRQAAVSGCSNHCSFIEISCLVSLSRWLAIIH